MRDLIILSLLITTVGTIIAQKYEMTTSELHPRSPSVNKTYRSVLRKSHLQESF